MAKRKPIPRDASGESRTAEMATVAWMMSVMSNVLCAGVAALVFLAVGDRPDADKVRLFAALLHFGGFVFAVLSLVLLGVVLKLRQQPPPPSITWFAVTVALLTIAAGFLY
ncbi:MAG: hypothetical protein DWQ37_15985 [Planctomycetota bacterium]|nr:MAG: hypothetical protein DWQ37_15985 [Planctomycetota bacterium]